MEEAKKRTKTSEAFFSYVVEKMSWDKQFISIMRNADTPDANTEAWKYLIRWCHSEDDSHIEILTLITASICRTGLTSDGKSRLGSAINRIDLSSHKDSAKLKKLLACDNVSEVCKNLRPILKSVERHNIRLSYITLMDQLLYFNRYPDKQKKSWAIDYYRARFSA